MAALFILLTLAILFLLTHAAILERCSRENRLMEPAKVWLNLIPFFNIYWILATILRTTDSLRNEFLDREIKKQSDCGRKVGLFGISLFIAGMLGAITEQRPSRLPTFGYDITLISLLLLTIYWFILGRSLLQLKKHDRLRQENRPPASLPPSSSTAITARSPPQRRGGVP